jgi:hypothetical protein
VQLAVVSDLPAQARGIHPRQAVAPRGATRTVGALPAPGRPICTVAPSLAVDAADAHSLRAPSSDAGAPPHPAGPSQAGGGAARVAPLFDPAPSSSTDRHLTSAPTPTELHPRLLTARRGLPALSGTGTCRAVARVAPASAGPSAARTQADALAGGKGEAEDVAARSVSAAAGVAQGTARQVQSHPHGPAREAGHQEEN